MSFVLSFHSRPYASAMELLRCLVVLFMDAYITSSMPDYSAVYHYHLIILRVVFGLSTLIWIPQIVMMNGKKKLEWNKGVKKEG